MALIRAMSDSSGGGGDSTYSFTTKTVTGIKNQGDYYIADITNNHTFAFFVEQANIYGCIEIINGTENYSYDSSNHYGYLTVSAGKLYYHRSNSSGGSYNVNVLIFEATT